MKAAAEFLTCRFLLFVGITHSLVLFCVKVCEHEKLETHKSPKDFVVHIL